MPAEGEGALWSRGIHSNGHIASGWELSRAHTSRHCSQYRSHQGGSTGTCPFLTGNQGTDRVSHSLRFSSWEAVELGFGQTVTPLHFSRQA